jgi:GNAT superfamily N-acetyltransferase
MNLISSDSSSEATPESFSELSRWWDWYSRPLSLARALSEWTWIQHIAQETQRENPVFRSQVQSPSEATAGYGVLAAGDLAIHGGILPHPVSNLYSDPTNTLVIPSRANQSELQAICLHQLIHKSFEQGAELYQTLVPIVSEFPDRRPDLHTLCSQVGMTYITRLIRMERLISQSESESGSGSIEYEHEHEHEHEHEQDLLGEERLRIETYERLPYETWVALLEATYQETSDVPELADLRSTRKALEGYRSHCTPGVEGWYAIWCRGVLAGCLILARNHFPVGEINYLGLIPEFRAQGHSRALMRFALDWMAAERCTKVALAVDCRNEPAMRVYQKWGFETTISYHAWVASPKTFRTSF